MTLAWPCETPEPYPFRSQFSGQPATLARVSVNREKPGPHARGTRAVDCGLWTVARREEDILVPRAVQPPANSIDLSTNHTFSMINGWASSLG